MMMAGPVEVESGDRDPVGVALLLTLLAVERSVDWLSVLSEA